ncbi:MAG: TorF family putative porin [Methylotenera sp.]
MKTIRWLLNRQVLSALCAAPLLLGSAYTFADEAAAPAAAPAEATPAVEAAPAAAPVEAAEPTADHLERKHTAAEGPASPWSFTLNAGMYSQYMFRGVALSNGPALQVGADLAHSSGFYVGTWWSNIDKEFTGHGDGFSGGNHLETDWYGGYAHTFDNGFGVNFLGNYYYYPDRENSFSAGNVGNKQNSFEASVALSYKWLTYTYYRVLTNYYGAAKDGTRDGTRDTKGASYNELKFNYKLPIGDLNFMTKVGYQHTPNLTGSQGDFAIGLNRDFAIPSAGKPIEGFNAGAYYTNTFNVKNEAFYQTSDGRDTNEDTVWFYVKRTW